MKKVDSARKKLNAHVRLLTELAGFIYLII